jgi:hypothetical protein
MTSEHGGYRHKMARPEQLEGGVPADAWLGFFGTHWLGRTTAVCYLALKPNRYKEEMIRWTTENTGECAGLRGLSSPWDFRDQFGLHTLWGDLLNLTGASCCVSTAAIERLLSLGYVRSELGNERSH